MNFNLRKTVLLMSACAAVGFAYPAYASSEVAPQAIQQSKKVSGTVVDAEGPVIGATVLEKGTSNATVTDMGSCGSRLWCSEKETRNWRYC